MPATPSPYIGRFAPTPSGFLHFGSLVAALASYLDARAAGGTWLLRIEDIDPPREVAGSRDAILHTLEQFGFQWDGEIVLQSKRMPAYEHTVEVLLKQGLAYPCRCSRKQLQSHPGPYPGFCRDRMLPLTDAAIRLRVPALDYHFDDRLQGRIHQHLAKDVGDFVIRRRDGLYAYQLAVVVDDAWQGVTHVVRGADLLDSTLRQIYLQEILGLPTPHYLHIPLLLQPDGHKLGKSYHATPIQAADAGPLLQQALSILGQRQPETLDPAEILTAAIAHWDISRLPRKASIEMP